MSVWALLLLTSPIEIGAWDVPAECSSRAAFMEKVEAEANAHSDADEPPVLEADVTVEEVGAAHWRLQLRLRRDGRDDTRAFDANTCAAVVEAAAVVVALRLVQWRRVEALVPAAKPSLPAPAVAPPSIPEPDPPPSLPSAAGVDAEPPEASPGPNEPDEEASALGGWVGVHEGLALGVAPGVGGAFALDGGVTGRWWRAGVALQVVPRRIEPHPEAPGIRARFDLVTGESFGCGVPKVGPVEFPVCGRFAVTGVRAVGEGAVNGSDVVWGTWLGAGGSVGVAWYVTERIAPALSAVALAPLQDWSFSVGGVPGALHRTGSVAFRAWLGLEVHW